MRSAVGERAARSIAARQRAALRKRNEHLEMELASVARARDELIGRAGVLRGELDGVLASLRQSEEKGREVKWRLDRLMEAALSGDEAKLRAAVMCEVREHWRTD